MIRIKSIALAAVLSMVLGFGNACLIFKLVTLQTRIYLSPPIAVIDIAKIVASYPQEASSAEIEKHMAKTRQSVMKLQKAGYLILDANTVVSAPADIYLDVEALPQ